MDPDNGFPSGGGKYGPDQDIYPPRQPGQVLELPLVHRKVKESLDRALFEQRIAKRKCGAKAKRISDTKRKLGPEAAERRTHSDAFGHAVARQQPGAFERFEPEDAVDPLHK
jgi:hypothetical protein